MPRPRLSRSARRRRARRQESLPFSVGDVLLVDRVMRDGRDGILPEELLVGDLRAEIARTAWTHVAMGQLEPCPREGVGECVRVRRGSASKSAS